MSYALSHLGETAVTAPEPVTNRTPPYTQQALSLMAVAAIPWLPVFGGALLTRRYGSGPGWGAIGGFALSFLVLRHAAKQMAGNIT